LESQISSKRDAANQDSPTPASLFGSPFARLCFLPISLILPVHPEFLQVHGWLSRVMTVPPALPSSPVDRVFLPAKSDNPGARESTTLFVSQTEL